MMLRHVLPVVVSLPIFCFVACGGSSDSASAPTATTDTGDDSGAPVATTPDAGTTSTGPGPIDPKYPTAHPALPIVDFNGGTILSAPHIITITVDGDSMRADLERFGTVITTTKWWDAVRAGYCDSTGACVGQGDAGDPVHLATTDFTTQAFTDSSQGGAATLQDFITSLISSGKFPAPTANTLYAIYLPSDSYTVNLDGSTSCGEFGGYHNSYGYPGVAATGTAAAIPAATVQYALVPRCGAEEITTVAASHEFIEAATDPHVGSGTAYYMQDQLWSLEGGEVGDLCVTQDNSDEVQESGFSVQRSWSNTAAKASHDPCVPAPAGDIYFNVAPKDETITAKVGDTKTIQLTAFSDAPIADWEIHGTDYAQEFGGSQSLSFAFDKTTVNNGTKINMTITVVAAPPTQFQGAALFSIGSKSGTTTHRWPGAVIVGSAQK
jgi:hypothetical protein